VEAESMRVYIVRRAESATGLGWGARVAVALGPERTLRESCASGCYSPKGDVRFLGLS